MLKILITSVSKKLGQSAVVIHYCALPQFFLKQTLLTLLPIFIYCTIDLGTTNDLHNPGPNSPQQSFQIRIPKHLTAVSSGANRTGSQISQQTPQSLRYGTMGCQVSEEGIQNQIYFFGKKSTSSKEIIVFCE